MWGAAAAICVAAVFAASARLYVALKPAIHALLSLVWLLVYGQAVARAGAVLRRPPVRRALHRLTGTVLVAFGARLAFERR